MRYLPLSEADRSAMLEKVGASSIDELFRDVPEEARLKGPIEGLPMHASEMAVERHMRRLSKMNLAAADAPFFLGAGAYRHHVPASVDHLSSAASSSPPTRPTSRKSRRARCRCCSSSRRRSHT